MSSPSEQKQEPSVMETVNTQLGAIAKTADGICKDVEGRVHQAMPELGIEGKFINRNIDKAIEWIENAVGRAEDTSIEKANSGHNATTVEGVDNGENQ